MTQETVAQSTPAQDAPEYSDAQFVERAVRNARDEMLTKWAAVRHIFACGSTVAAALCRRFGFDPDAAARTATSDLPWLTAQPEAHQEPVAWRCFHCDEEFTDRDAAREHFGQTERSDPACRINIKAFRQLEAVLHRWTDQGATDAEYAADNAWRAREGQHRVALQREEEKGYARGLADGRAHPAPPVVDARAALERADHIIAFLLGVQPLEGVWFGEKHPTLKGNFWWRTLIRQAYPYQPPKMIATPPAPSPTASAGETRDEAIPADLALEREMDRHTRDALGDSEINPNATNVGDLFLDPSETVATPEAQSMRERFEAWSRGELGLSPTWFEYTDRTATRYTARSVEDLWRAWQAAESEGARAAFEAAAKLCDERADVTGSLLATALANRIRALHGVKEAGS